MAGSGTLYVSKISRPVSDKVAMTGCLREFDAIVEKLNFLCSVGLLSFDRFGTQRTVMPKPWASVV